MSFYKQVSRWFNECLPYGIMYWYMQFLMISATKYMRFKYPAQYLLRMYPDDICSMAFISIVVVLGISLGKWFIGYYKEKNELL